MTEHRKSVQDIADGIISLEEEVESSGSAVIDDEALARSKARLHEWIDTVAGVVLTPALGRVTLIHHDGKRSSISSSTLPFTLSVPVK